MNDDLQTDPLQPEDDLFSPTRDEEVLEQDGATPSSPADTEEGARMPSDYPTTDTDIDAGGAYFGGVADEVGYGPEPESDEYPSPLTPEDTK
jgi:hypothetical protein